MPRFPWVPQAPLTLAALLFVACATQSPSPPRGDTPSAGLPSAASAPRPTSPAPAPAAAEAGAPAPADTGKPEPDPAAAGECLDVRAVLMRCTPDQRLTHDGCAGPAYMQHCAPK